MNQPQIEILPAEAWPGKTIYLRTAISAKYKLISEAVRRLKQKPSMTIRVPIGELTGKVAQGRAHKLFSRPDAAGRRPKIKLETTVHGPLMYMRTDHTGE